jgi:hypothetical protein
MNLHLGLCEICRDGHNQMVMPLTASRAALRFARYARESGTLSMAASEGQAELSFVQSRLLKKLGGNGRMSISLK